MTHFVVRQGAVDAGDTEDRVPTTRVLLEVGGRDVEHIAADGHPCVLLGGVQRDLLKRDGAVGVERDSNRLGDCAGCYFVHRGERRRGAGGGRPGERGRVHPLEGDGRADARERQAACDAPDARDQGGDGGLRRLHHPAAGLLARHGRVLEAQLGDGGARVGAVDLDPEDGVVEHAHHVPRQMVGLRVHVVVPRAAAHLLCREQPRDGDGEGPEAVAPVLAVLGRCLGVLDHAALPRDPAVE
mmetsp:Transcript_31359/g.78437  ORF Transcript_31359/g.78437 Transcript_31359/m.78437 type:complete len:242 (-) Transcript_31359:1139-1864(-)